MKKLQILGTGCPKCRSLRKVLKPRLIAAFVGVVAIGILLVGYLFNAVM